MSKKLSIIVVVLLLIGSAYAWDLKTVDIIDKYRVDGDKIVVFHDERGVTCWKYWASISCVADSQLNYSLNENNKEER